MRRLRTQLGGHLAVRHCKGHVCVFGLRMNEECLLHGMGGVRYPRTLQLKYIQDGDPWEKGIK